MATFPTLKTGAVAQYPASRQVGSTTRVLRFMDGSEQRIRLGRLRRRWVISLDQLDEGEAAAVMAFVDSIQGSYQEFEFTDPWTGLVYPACHLADDSVSMDFNDAHMARTTLVISEATN